MASGQLFNGSIMCSLLYENNWLFSCTVICLECSYCVNRKWEECEFKVTKEGFSYYFLNDHEPKDVFKHYNGLGLINANMKTISRNLDYAQHRYHLQKWECLIAEGPVGIKHDIFIQEGPS